MVGTLVEIGAVLVVGLWVTIRLSLIALLVGSGLGVVFGLIRALDVPFVSPLISCLVHIGRGTPFLVQLFVVYFVLPQTGLSIFQMSPMTAGVLALSAYTSTYATEIVRSALLAVPQSQLDAGKALGLSRTQRMRLVVFPQALRLMLPPTGGLYVVIVKSTSILSVVGITELVRTGEVLALRIPQDLQLVYLGIALCYFAFCYPLLASIRWLEKRVALDEYAP